MKKTKMLTTSLAVICTLPLQATASEENTHHHYEGDVMTVTAPVYSPLTIVTSPPKRSTNPCPLAMGRIT